MVFLFLVITAVVPGCDCGDDDDDNDDVADDDDNDADDDNDETSCTETLPEQDLPENPYATVTEQFDLIVPSGNRVYGMIRRPDPQQVPDLCFAAVVMVPGGVNPGRMDAVGNPEVQMLAATGMVVVTFNAEGRVKDVPDDIASEGEEDVNGFQHQDSLCAIAQWIMEQPYVIADNVGLRSQSFGITMAAGCAGRHPEVSIKYIVDGEGPPNSFVSAHEPWALDSDTSNDKHETAFEELGHYSTERDPSAENQAFWAEREAIRFIGDFRGYYLRLQAQWDHAQPPSKPSETATFRQPPVWWQNKHTTDIVNAAIAGGMTWVRVNLEPQGNAVSATFDMDNPPIYIPGTLKDAPTLPVQAVIEMARMPDL